MTQTALKSLLDVTVQEVDSFTPLQAQWLSQALIHDSKYSYIPYTHEYFLGTIMAYKVGSPAYERNHAAMNILIERLEKYSTKRLSMWLAPLIIRLVQGHPASIVLYAYALHRSNFEGVITVAKFHDLFKNGLPNERTLFTYWEDQKVKEPTGFNNLLDKPETWA
jgi:hypothetical protein